MRSTGVNSSRVAASASLARAESGGTRLAGAIELRRPEWIRSTIARRPARMLSSPRRRGPASVRHSQAVSTPPVRSVQPMDPTGSVDRGRLMGYLGSWCRGQVEEGDGGSDPRSLRGRCDRFGARSVHSAADVGSRWSRFGLPASMSRTTGRGAAWLAR